MNNTANFDVQRLCVSQPRKRAFPLLGLCGILLATSGAAVAGTVLLPGNSTATGNRAVVIEGFGNAANGNNSLIGHGTGNTADGGNAIILNGTRNLVTGVSSQGTIINGKDNTVAGSSALVGSGSNNTASGLRSAVVNGSSNLATGREAIVGSGFRNEASGIATGIVGGSDNIAADSYAAVGGGVRNAASAAYTTVGGGSTGVAGTIYATIGGGLQNLATGRGASVAGGERNEAIERVATVGGGIENIASGRYSTVTGGRENTAGGDYSQAGGYRASALALKSFAWGSKISVVPSATGTSIFSDGDPGNQRGKLGFPLSFSDTHTMIGVFGSGYQFYTDALATVGVRLAGGDTAWSVMSDRNLKEDFQPVDAVEVLKKVAEMPMTSWKYKHDRDTRYMGVMAQDLYEAFGLGKSDKAINTLVADGVQIAAIQGLNELVEEKEKRINKLEARLEKLEKLLENGAK